MRGVKTKFDISIVVHKISSFNKHSSDFKMSKKNSKSGNNKRVFFYRLTNSILKEMQNEISTKSEDAIALIHNNSNTDRSNTESLSDSLKNWAIEYGLTHRACTSLLKILNSAGVQCKFKDSRGLLKTPRNLKIPELCGGKFWYAGIKKSLQRLFVNLKETIEIKLDFNIDGLPLFNSSKVTFWPILASIDGKYRNICY